MTDHNQKPGDTMTTKVNRHTMTTPDGHTVRATYCHAIIECGTPDGATQLTGALVPVAAGVTYAHLVPNATFTADGLEALGAVTRAVSDSMAQDGKEKADGTHLNMEEITLTAADYNTLITRAEKAEQALEDPYSEENQATQAWKRVSAHPALAMNLLPVADCTYAGAVFDRITELSNRAKEAEKERDELRDAGVTVLPGNQGGKEYWRARAWRVERELDQLAANLRQAKAERPAILDDLHKLVDQWATEPDVKRRGPSARTQLQAIIACYTPVEC